MEMPPCIWVVFILADRELGDGSEAELGCKHCYLGRARREAGYMAQLEHEGAQRFEGLLRSGVQDGPIARRRFASIEVARCFPMSVVAEFFAGRFGFDVGARTSIEDSLPAFFAANFLQGPSAAGDRVFLRPRAMEDGLARGLRAASVVADGVRFGDQAWLETQSFFEELHEAIAYVGRGGAFLFQVLEGVCASFCLRLCHAVCGALVP